MGTQYAGDTTLFLIDHIIAYENLNKRREPLLELAISGRHRGHSLWLLTQSHTAVPLNIRRQIKMLSAWYLKKRQHRDTIHEENNVMEMQEELENGEKHLRQGKHTCFIMRMEQPRAYEIH